jgi:coproporphyrinogen III oxidase
MHDQCVAFFRSLQDQICDAIARIDSAKTFHEDTWDREGGGGGRSRVIAEGGVFEKAGVNFSEVFGEMSPDFAKQIPGEGTRFTATGISLVLHPRSPLIPTVHANFRFLTKGERWWFGGGGDLTPYYPFRDDVVHFHRAWRDACRRHPDIANYEKMKKDCDDYFYLPHREEPRGVGGIFFDYLSGDFEKVFAFVRDAGETFVPAYAPIAQRRAESPWTERQRQFQEYRRGRYVEFNLLYDRGTIFGLKTGGRIESILMSLPPLVRYLYDWTPEPGSPEAELYDVYLKPRDWANDGV